MQAVLRAPAVAQVGMMVGYSQGMGSRDSVLEEHLLAVVVPVLAPFVVVASEEAPVVASKAVVVDHLAGGGMVAGL